MSNWRESVSQTVGSERIQNIANYVKFEDQNDKSPLDNYYDENKKIMATSTPQFLLTYNWIGSYLLIAIVSNTENYFREIFGKILKFCPDSQKLAANQGVNLGSVIWHPNDSLERSAFENISLASSEGIITTSRKYIGFDTKNLQSILVEFDKVCELRHGIVHSGNVLAGKNGLKLQLSPTEKITKVDIQYAQLQEVSSICTTLIVSFNKLLFEEMSTRWATSWRKSASWSQTKENEYFKILWNTFHSKNDAINRSIPLDTTWKRCCNMVKKDFNI